MRRTPLLSLGLVALVAVSGCTVLDSERYPTPRRGGADYRPADYRVDRRADTRRADARRVERDVRDYVRTLDRELRLERRQERQIQNLLEDRAYRYLRNVRGRDYDRAYPFPRRLGSDRYRSRQVADFWRDADRRIERQLDRRQAREYRYIAGYERRRGYRDDRRYRDGRYDDRRRDRRYEDRRRDRDDDDDGRDDDD